MWDMSVSSTTYNGLSVILPFENTTKARRQLNMVNRAHNIRDYNVLIS